MLALPVNGSMSKASPGLVFFSQSIGTLVDPLLLQFQIFDKSSEAKQLTPVQVFPSTVDTWQPVDLSDGGADRISIGYFAPSWTVGGTEPTGLHEIRWQFQLPPINDPLTGVLTTQPVVTVSQDFEVVTAGDSRRLGGPFYCLLSDMRAEGMTTQQASDARLMLTIARASRLIERWTNWHFEPRYMTLKMDGRGSSLLQLELPVVGIEQLVFQTSPLFPSGLAVEPDFYRIYNRHLRDGMLNYDDRQNPKIELFTASEDLAGVRPFTFSRLIFPRGQHNVTIKGVFGYTEPDGTPMGRTPDMLRRVCQLLVIRDFRKLTDWDEREDRLKRFRLISESTRDQSYTMEANKLYGAFTGDSEIDQMLVTFCRPAALGGA